MGSSRASRTCRRRLSPPGAVAAVLRPPPSGKRQHPSSRRRRGRGTHLLDATLARRHLAKDDAVGRPLIPAPLSAGDGKGTAPPRHDICSPALPGKVPDESRRGSGRRWLRQADGSGALQRLGRARDGHEEAGAEDRMPQPVMRCAAARGLRMRSRRGGQGRGRSCGGGETNRRQISEPAEPPGDRRQRPTGVAAASGPIRARQGAQRPEGRREGLEGTGREGSGSGSCVFRASRAQSAELSGPPREARRRPSRQEEIQ